ncbi:recombination regulator RecX [Nocardia abscessus]|uniref:recombination regulator RecX n=1 Tax=Nocardia abscessus TaxID=120957 RepID=UPI0024555F53|nr:recombination regulator RecX [Nocardia abscessus]
MAAGSEGGTVEQAKEACLRLLAVRARSRAELAQRLAAKGYSAEVSERALERLADVGLIDDAAFAEQWVHSRHTFSGKGKQALAQELRRKGVTQSDAASALDAITADDEEERAGELVRRKLRSLPRDLDREKAIRRLVGMLARRGYSQATAYRVVKAELADQGVGGARGGPNDRVTWPRRRPATAAP